MSIPLTEVSDNVNSFSRFPDFVLFVRVNWTIKIFFMVHFLALMVLDLNKKGPAIDLQDTSLLTRPISVKVKMRVNHGFQRPPESNTSL